MKEDLLYSKIVEEAIELALLFDGSGNILFGNRAVREKLGYTQEELKERNMSQLFWQEFQVGSGAFAPFDRALLEEKQETVIYRKNRACFPVSLRFFQAEGDTGWLLAEDITQKNEMDLRIRQLEEEHEANLKMRNEFTANVTHELRTPVNGIKGHVSTLLETAVSEEQKRTLDVILYCCDNMSAIINNILDFSKLEAGKFTLEESEFDFYKMIDRITQTHMATVSKKELRLNVHVDENIPQMLIGDELRIGQILNNLLSNAIKFTMVGQVSVDVSRTMQVDDEVELFFMVKDSGIGISREEQDKLFQSFNQADASITRRFGGTGLGLSITKQLVEMMGGLIHVESEKGKGSCFSFNIRLHTGESVGQNKEFVETYRKWNQFTGGMESEAQDDYLVFGTEANISEIKKRMEKLILSIELGSWEKAETLAETLKALTDSPEGDMKRTILRLEMAVRKENYERSMDAYERLKEALTEKLGQWQ